MFGEFISMIKTTGPDVVGGGREGNDDGGSIYAWENMMQNFGERLCKGTGGIIFKIVDEVAD